MNDNNALVKKELTQLEKDILLVIQDGEISSAKQIANTLDIPESKVIEILNNDEFYSYICANSLSNMRLAYHSKAIPRLINNLDNDKDFYDSYDRITKAIGAVKERDNESLKVSLEVLLKEAKVEKDVTPHTKDINTVSKEVELNKISGNIFEVKDNQVSSHSKEIEFEFEED